MKNRVTIVLEEDATTGYFLNLAKQYGDGLAEHPLCGSKIVALKIESIDYTPEEYQRSIN